MHQIAGHISRQSQLPDSTLRSGILTQHAAHVVHHDDDEEAEHHDEEEAEGQVTTTKHPLLEHLKVGFNACDRASHAFVCNLESSNELAETCNRMQVVYISNETSFEL